MEIKVRKIMALILCICFCVTSIGIEAKTKKTTGKDGDNITWNYNKETKTATLRLQGNGGKHLNGKSIRFGIQSFLTNKKFYDNMDVLLDWNELLSTTPEIITLGDY